METTLLPEDLIWGDNALDVLKEYGTKAGMTDLAILLGGLMSSSNTTSDGLKSGDLWSASSNSHGYVRTVYSGGD